MIGVKGVSAEKFTNLIGAIYDCALDPQRWEAICQQIAELSKSTAGGICVHDLRHVQNEQLFVFGYQPEFLEKLANYFAENPIPAADIASKSCDVSAFIIERYQLLETRFFREVLKPFGLQDMVWFPAMRTEGRMASLHASRSEN